MGRPPEPNLQDLRHWRRLIRVALVMAEDPRSPAGELAKAAAAARKSVAPSLDGAKVDKDNPFVRLQAMAHRFVAATNAQRRALAPELKALAEQCGGLPAGRASPDQVAPSPPRRHRADLDG